MSPGDPEAVERFAGILADWLASYTIAAPLAAEMADALEAGSAWVGAIGAGAVRRAGWPDAESVAWGIAVSALAAAHEAAIRSLEGGTEARDPGSGAEGPARALLAADGLIAAAHETLAALGEERLIMAIDSLEEEFGDGGPWRSLGRPHDAGGMPGAETRAWTLFVALALAPAAADRPDGPWAALAAAWRELYGTRRDDDAVEPAPNRDLHDDDDLFRHPAVDESTASLLEAAAVAALRPRPKRTHAGA